jgi:hypothetical protein
MKYERQEDVSAKYSLALWMEQEPWQKKAKQRNE